MGLRVAAALTGLVGGLAWISVWVFDRASARAAVVDSLTWAGLALLAMATLAAGASLVSRSATWLRVIVAVCFAALVGSILLLLADSFDDQVVYAAFGTLAALVSVVVLARSERKPSGSHAR